MAWAWVPDDIKGFSKGKCSFLSLSQRDGSWPLGAVAKKAHQMAIAIYVVRAAVRRAVKLLPPSPHPIE